MSDQVPVGKPGTFRKKPVEIKAMRFDGTAESSNQILAWIISNGGNPRLVDPSRPELGLIISTLEGDMTVKPSDSVIQGVKGEFYPCKDDIFQATYDAVTPVA